MRLKVSQPVLPEPCLYPELKPHPLCAHCLRPSTQPLTWNFLLGHLFVGVCGCPAGTRLDKVSSDLFSLSLSPSLPPSLARSLALALTLTLTLTHSLSLSLSLFALLYFALLWGKEKGQSPFPARVSSPSTILGDGLGCTWYLLQYWCSSMSFEGKGGCPGCKNVPEFSAPPALCWPLWHATYEVKKGRLGFPGSPIES